MFSIWPDLFAFELLGIAILRVSVAYLFLISGFKLLRALRHTVDTTSNRRVFGTLYGITTLMIGLLLLVGLYTQPAALAGAALLLSPTNMRGGTSCAHHLTFLLLAACLALLVLGPGVPAIDLPI